MKAHVLPQWTPIVLTAGVAVFLLGIVASVDAETPLCPAPVVPVPCCPAPYPSTIPSPSMTDPSMVPPQNQNTPADVDFNQGGSGARPGDTAAFAAPNMHGDLLFSSRSVQFGFTRINANTDFIGLGSTSIVNSSVADNNSPVPEDRVSFRYNFFSNSQSVTGIGPNSFPVTPGTATSPPVLFQEAQTKQYDTSMYTFSVEKTFFDGLMSLEMRAPVITSLSNNNTLSVGNFAGFTGGTPDINGNVNFNTVTTPENTLGHSDTYFGDITLIWKSLLYSNKTTGLFVSGGLSLGIPTSPDTKVTVVDYVGGTPQSFAGNSFSNSQQTRNIEIADDTWTLSPFVAVLYTPTPRFYTQGFMELEVPLNRSAVTYSDRFTIGTGSLIGATAQQLATINSAIAAGQSMLPPFTVHTNINEQTLLHLDWGMGYWLMRQPENTWLTGIAAALELHYTGTLTNADRVQLPGNATILDLNPANPTAAAQGKLTPALTPNVGPVLGSTNSRVNIVDLTLGTTFVLNDRATIGTAFTVPLTNDANKTFDWEFQLQFNYYFGKR
jgi:hypothetical protein